MPHEWIGGEIGEPDEPVYHITEWSKRYEPPVRERSKSQNYGLTYWKAPIHGSKWGLSWREAMRLSDEARLDVASLVGVFHKMAELVGALPGSPATLRNGTVLDVEHKPGTASTIALEAGLALRTVSKALPVLVQLGWVDLTERLVLVATAHPIATKRDEARPRAPKARPTETETETETTPRRPPKGGARHLTWKGACEAMKGNEITTDTIRKLWMDYLDECPKMAKPKKLTPRAVTLRIRKLEGMGHDAAIYALTNAIETGNPNLFPPRARQHGQAGPPRRAGDGRRAEAGQ